VETGNQPMHFLQKRKECFSKSHNVLQAKYNTIQYSFNKKLTKRNSTDIHLSSNLLTDMRRDITIFVWQVISHGVDARPCNDFVVLRRVRNCLYIIIKYWSNC